MRTPVYVLYDDAVHMYVLVMEYLDDDTFIYVLVLECLDDDTLMF